MNFLKSNVENKDRITMAIQSFGLGSNFKRAKSKLKKKSTNFRKMRCAQDSWCC